MSKYFAKYILLVSLVLLVCGCHAKISREEVCASVCQTMNTDLSRTVEHWVLVYSPTDCINCYLSLQMLFEVAPEIPIQEITIVTVAMREAEKKATIKKLTLNAPPSLAYHFVFEDELFEGFTECLGQSSTNLVYWKEDCAEWKSTDFKQLHIDEIKDWPQL